MIKKDEGLILRVTPFSESDAIVSIYTKNHGKKSFFVKAGLSHKSKKRPFLQEGYWVEFVFYERTTRELQKITDIHLIQLFIELTTHPIKNCLLLCMIELFREVVREEEIPDEDLYQFLTQYIISMDASSNVFEVWLNFHEDLLTKIGYGTRVEEPLPNYVHQDFYHSFIKTSYQAYNEFSKNIDNFKIPKSFEVLKQLISPQ
jgi:DNA repair protein RecO (recombination protein O)